MVRTRSGKVFGEGCNDNGSRPGDVDRSKTGKRRRITKDSSVEAKNAKSTKVEKGSVALTAQGPQQWPSGAYGMERVRQRREEFEEILKERKAERKRQAEESRLEGLRKIRERNSETAFSPLDIFPMEIWMQILSELGFEDLVSMWELHNLFRNLLEGNQIRDILFPQVLDPQGRFAQRWLEELSQQGYLYYFFDPFSSTLRLNQRLVSKSMRDAIDKLLEEDLLFSMRTEYPSDQGSRVNVRTHIIRKPVAFLMTDDFDVNGLDKIMEIKKPMRIIGRELMILIRPTRHYVRGQGRERYLEYFNQFKANVTHALQEVGDQIWRLKFTCGDHVYRRPPFVTENFGLSTTELYQILREWLLLLPNIKWLEICLHQVHSGTLDELTRQTNPLPTLNALERIDFLNQFNRFNETLCEALIASYPQIKMLNYNFCDPDFFQRICQPRRVQSPNLERLIVGVWDVPRNHPFKLFKPIMKCSLNLKMINLTFNGDGSSINSILKMLNHFPLLEDVKLDVGRVSIGNEVDYLRLPNLKDFALKFKLNNRKDRAYVRNLKLFHSLHFLLHSAKLRSLKWTDDQLDCGELQRKFMNFRFEGMIDFKGGFEDLSESNLWDVFPRLEIVQVEFTKQEGYDGYTYGRKYVKRELVEKKKRGRYYGYPPEIFSTP